MLTNSAMATRNASGIPDRSGHCTDFQLYGENGPGVVDYTEKKLERYAGRTSDPQQKMVLFALIDDYRSGDIAVAWRAGQPIWLRVIKAA